jgi:hypothetical protein
MEAKIALFSPRFFPVYTKESERLCTVIGILSGKMGMYGTEFDIWGESFITVEDHTGARAVFKTGMLGYKDPLCNVKKGDKLLVRVKHKQNFPLEMKIVSKVKEIYFQDKVEPVALVA